MILLSLCAVFLSPCEFTSMEGNVLTHELVLESPGDLVQGVTTADWLPVVVLYDGVDNCNALPDGECGVYCPAYCPASPCTVALGDPGAGYIVFWTVSGNDDMRVGPRLDPPVVCE